MLQQMNTFITESTELTDESGQSQRNSSLQLQKPCLYEKSFVDVPEVKQEDADDLSVHYPVDERCTTISNKVTLLFMVI